MAAAVIVESGEYDDSVRSDRKQTAGPAELPTSRLDGLCSRLGYVGIRRSGGARRLHASRPGRTPPVDFGSGIQGRFDAGTIDAGALGGAVGDLSGICPLWHTWR